MRPRFIETSFKDVFGVADVGCTCAHELVRAGAGALCVCWWGVVLTEDAVSGIRETSLEAVTLISKRACGQSFEETQARTSGPITETSPSLRQAATVAESLLSLP